MVVAPAPMATIISLQNPASINPNSYNPYGNNPSVTTYYQNNVNPPGYMNKPVELPKGSGIIQMENMNSATMPVLPNSTI